jgi:prepilin-type processing-associated H-X9-DG protein
LGCGGSGLFIILILAAILFPVFAKAREKARQITCADNMKQIGLALAQYSQDNDSKLPLAATWEKASSTYEMHKFSCPDVAVGSGYAYNSTLGNEKITKFSDGSTTVSVFETTKTEPNANDKLTSIVTPGRHSGSNNYLFLDGHIDSSTSPPSP